MIGTALTAAVLLAATMHGVGASGTGTSDGGVPGITWPSLKSGSGKYFDKEFSAYTSNRPITIGEAALTIGSGWLSAFGVTGAGVDIAMIDTGVAPVPDLDGAGKVVNGPDLSLDFQSGLPVAVDAYGHGTHLASIAANSRTGIARGARIVNMKVGAIDGAVDVSQVIAAIDWVVQHRSSDGLNIRVLNLAFGTDSVQGYQVDPLAHAVESAWKNGIVVVASAGNDAGPVSVPAVDPFVIAVGAADTHDPYNPSDDTLATFSATGSSTRRVDVLAPGVSILGLRVPGSTIDTENPDAVVNTRYFKGSGTSQAAAVASGAVAQLLQARPGLSPDQVKSVLVATGRSIDGVDKAAQGGGLINVGRALWASASDKTQAWAPSTGAGTIEASRGSYHLVAADGTKLTGEVDVQGAPWVPATWAPLSAAGSAWTGNVWNGNEWTGTGWSTADQISGIAWTAASWRGATWRGATWRADLWAAASWRTGVWDGATWRAKIWDGATWR